MSVCRFLILVLLIAARPASAADGAPSSGPEMTFVSDGAVITFQRPARVARMELSAPGSAGEPEFLLAERLHERPVTRHRLFFHPTGRLHTLKVFLPGQERPLVVKRSPPLALPRTDFALVLQAPYAGEADITERWGHPRPGRSPFFPPGGRFTAEVELMTWRLPVEGELRLVLGSGLEPAGEPAGWKRGKGTGGRTTLSRTVTVSAPMQVVQFLVPIRVTGAEGDRSRISVRFRPDVGGGRWFLDESAMVQIISTDGLKERIGMSEVLMPTDAQGEIDVRKTRDTVALPSRMGLAVRRYLGFSEQYFDYYAPFTHQTVIFENKGAESLPVAVTTRVAHADDNSPVPGFRAPDYLAGPGGRFTVTAELAPREKTPVVLPVFARPERLLPGRYRSVIEARVLGTDTVAARLEHPFQVRATDVRALLVTAAAIVVSLAGFLLFIGKQRKIFAAFRVSELVLIALFATMTFVLVVFPGSVLGPIFNAVAGPFGFLIQGIFFEVLRILVLVTLLVLVPRVGTVTLVSIVRYLIGGLAFGGFTPVDLFYLGASVVLMEAALYAGGVTSKRGVLRRREIGVASFLYVAVLLGLVNGATQYVIYCLNISFYRLYFAGWFIWLSVMVNGFLYAALGTLPGLKLGLRLRRISE